ncbi:MULTISPECIES: MFS transporter [unclassified Streptomyces]|uniref:MFS transporter n=1 Tax=unclassified Streptomyces TaxID=2593676 RepID=UPI000DC34C0F|nr:MULTISPECIES: MFS transporter [unclassified Streptomyces]MYT73488.1 MFS transporter [Streptomyces sp. SID8367]RAJ85021.1 putative MFS family arabinose efflux permease [Streptomyces sp. PsTaAH-137]
MTEAVPVAPTTSAPAATSAKKNVMVGTGLFIGAFGLSLANHGVSTLLQAASKSIAPDDPIGFYATLTTFGAVASVLAIVFAGALSDRTRSRFGRRIPWLAGSGLLGATGLALAGFGSAGFLVVIGYIAFMMALNASIAASTAVVPDVVDARRLGLISSLMGAGNLIGGVIGGFFAAAYITRPQTGLSVLPAVFLLTALVMVVLLPRVSSLGQARTPGGIRGFLRSFELPKGGQFWWVFTGRFLFALALFMTVMYAFFVATGYLGLGTQKAGDLLAVCTLVMSVGSVAAALLTGPVSDRIGRKPFVIGAPILIAAGAVPLILTAQPWALIAFYGPGGIAFGAYLAVDAALMVDVLPDRSRAAQDLAILQAANSLPLVVAPSIAGVLTRIGGFEASFVGTVVAGLAAALCILRVKGIR